MARVVNTDTTLGRRAAFHRVWLVVLLLAGVLLAGNLVRGVVAEMGGLQHARDIGLLSAASSSVSRVFNFPGGHLPPPYAARRLVLLVLHLVGLGAISQLIWLPLTVLRRRIGEQQVLRELQRLPGEYWVLTDLVVPGQQTPSRVDHLVVSPHGVWCLEIKAHTGHVVGGEYDYEWLQLKRRNCARRCGNSFFNPVRQNTTHCAHVSDYLMHAQMSVPVRSMIVFVSAEPETMTITHVERLGSFVDAILEADAVPVMDRHKTERIARTLAELLATQAPRAATAAAPAAVAAPTGGVHGT